MNIEISEHANKILENYQDLTGAPEDYIIEMLIYKLETYMPDEGFGQKGILIQGNEEIVQKTAKITGEKVHITETPCVLLGKTTINNSPYYKIFADGKIMKIPAGYNKLKVDGGLL